MTRRTKARKSKKSREYRPLYVATKKKKAKFPSYLKDYHACVAKGKGKRFCKKKYYPKK
jgi:hypothetical protein